MEIPEQGEGDVLASIHFQSSVSAFDLNVQALTTDLDSGTPVKVLSKVTTWSCFVQIPPMIQHLYVRF